MNGCIFCKMFTGEVDFRKVYDGKEVLGVLDIQPRFARWQCLVIPRRHVAQFYELEDEEIAQLFKGVKAVAKKLKKAVDTPLVSIFARGMSIPIHAHIVVFPASEEGPLDKIMAGLLAYEQLKAVTPSQLDAMAERIRTA